MGCNQCPSDEDNRNGICQTCQKQRRERVLEDIHKKQEQQEEEDNPEGGGNYTLSQFR